MPRPSVRERVQRLDFDAIAESLDERGSARAGPLLTPDECEALVALYPEDRLFRSRVVMARHGFGVGDYAYFEEPLPPIVRDLRVHLYRGLAPIANRWAERLSEPPRFPASLGAYRSECRTAGQTRPTCLLLRYEAEGYNCLHRDLYGELAFPLQATVLLSRSGADFEGGAFLLVEQRPRAQSRGDAVALAQGDMIVFPTSSRPVRGKRGFVRATMRHGVARLSRGVRYALGIIFHDAR